MMVRIAAQKILFLDAAAAAHVSDLSDSAPIPRVALDDSDIAEPFGRWSLSEGSVPKAVEISPAWGFNIIYSSGTTGTPKGIVQPHSLRWMQMNPMDQLDTVLAPSASSRQGFIPTPPSLR